MGLKEKANVRHVGVVSGKCSYSQQRENNSSFKITFGISGPGFVGFHPFVAFSGTYFLDSKKVSKELSEF
jgi:hypothetical protein